MVANLGQEEKYLAMAKGLKGGRNSSIFKECNVGNNHVGDGLQNPFMVIVGLQNCPCAEKAKHMMRFAEDLMTLKGT